MLIAVPYVAKGVIKWHDDLPQERRHQVDRNVDSVRIWFLNIDWPKHRETLVGMGVRCCSRVSTALVKIGDCLNWCSPWLTLACSKLWTGIKWMCRGTWWLLKLFVGGIGTGIFWLINSWESRKLAEVQKELAECRASQKETAEKKDREHMTELTKLKTQLKSKDQQITGLDYKNIQVTRSWTVAVNARIQDAQNYNTQLDRVGRYSDLDSQHGTNVAKETGAKYGKLLKVHTEQQKEHERDVELFSQHFTELQGKLDQQKTAFCSEHTQQITDLQSNVSTMSAATKTKFNELEASSTRAGKHFSGFFLHTSIPCTWSPTWLAVDVSGAHSTREVWSPTWLAVEVSDAHYTIRRDSMTLESSPLTVISTTGDLERDLRIERAQKEALREDFSNQYFQLSKSFDDFKSVHMSCVSCSDHQALRQELDQTKSAKGGDRTTENELKATLATVRKELADTKANNDLFKKKGHFNAFAAYSAKFPNSTTYQPQPTTDQQTLGLDALCFSLQHQYGFTSLTVADLQRVCDGPTLQGHRVEPDNGFVHDPNQLAFILGCWSKQQQRPLAFGYRTTTQVSGKFSVFDILKFASKSREVVWVTRRTPGEAQEGAQPGDPSVGTWFGLQARVPTPDQSESGTGVAGPSNDQPTGNENPPTGNGNPPTGNDNPPTGNGNPPDGKAAADTPGPKGEQGPQNGKPSGTNASTPGKDSGASKGNNELQPPSRAEEEFKNRFPKGFKIMDGDDPGEMSGLQATIKTMKAMQEEAKYKSMSVPTYDELDEIRDSPEGRKALEKAYGGEFGEDNINAAGINYVLNLWGKQRGLNLQLGTMRRKPGEVHQPQGHGFLDDIVDLGISSNPNVDGANCIVVWIYNDDGADPTVGFYAEWAGLRPRLTIGGAASKA